MAQNRKPGVAKATALPTRVMLCPTCKPHAYQDGRYDKNMRVHNPGAQDYRCTVCQNKVPYTSAAKVDPKPEDKKDAKKPAGKGK